MGQLDAINSANLPFVEDLLKRYIREPESVPAEWRRYFDALRQEDAEAISQRTLGPRISPPRLFGNGHPDGEHGAAGGVEDDVAIRQERVDQLIRNYRVRGHMIAEVDPLGTPPPKLPELDPAFYGFSEDDLDREVSTTSMAGAKRRTVREVLASLQRTYCRSIGAQFMHIDDLSVRQWLQQRMESTENRIRLSRDEQIRILTCLTDAVIFEQFVQKKYVGAKTFSLEGAESLIPLLDLAIEKAGSQGIVDIVLGMAHRGRLNVLANVMGKTPHEIFREFEDADPTVSLGGGDVKYHLGYSADFRTLADTPVHVSLCFNPSHLEFVNPVAVGRTRARQDRMADASRSRVMNLLIHGDASFAGEGIVQECLNMSELAPYEVGGTLHVILNNQLGFTTAPREGRSSTYCTDVCKMLQIPIFHVNGEDPEAVAQAISLAMEFRQTFQRDVVVDMYGYRRHGHNEADEPSFTQPTLYQRIRQRPSVRDAYLERILDLGSISREEADRLAEQRQERLEEALTAVRSEEESRRRRETPDEIWAQYRGGSEEGVPEAETGIDPDRARAIIGSSARLPEGFHLHRKLERLLRNRQQMADGERDIDWATAEALAMGSLAEEGYRIRLTGQDTARGTFSHRHAVLHDVETGREHVPLKHVAENQAPVEIANSPLSEAGVLGFEYGYSLDWPDGLIGWEAQFGDFVNAAQVIIDQFITSAEDKWRRFSGLVLLLPHGFEGQGPEHASARMERFLTLAAEHNIQLANPTTPAQYFHLLRRQVIRPWRKPLVVLTPKSLLRHPRVISPVDAFASGTFRRVLPETQIAPESPERVLLCTGKIYYELLRRREELGRDDLPIVRIEQLYPFPDQQLADALAGYPDGTPVRWVQEEPRNMGAWPFLRRHYCIGLWDRFPFDGITRLESASPATGSHASHEYEQERLLTEAVGERPASA